MKTYKLNNMKRGWFVGNFLPTCYNLPECEVACQYYKKGDVEDRHVHKVATELTLIAVGHASMNGIDLQPGDILMLDPQESSDFQALEDTISIVVKIPSISGDKYPA